MVRPTHYIVDAGEDNGSLLDKDDGESRGSRPATVSLMTAGRSPLLADVTGGGAQCIVGGVVGKRRRRQPQQTNWLVEVTEDGSTQQGGAAPGNV